MDKIKAAIYLAGHGSLVHPRLIELQYRRIQRYRELLRDRIDTIVSGRDVFIDLRLPECGMGQVDIREVEKGPSIRHFKSTICGTPTEHARLRGSWINDAGAAHGSCGSEDNAAVRPSIEAALGRSADSH